MNPVYHHFDTDIYELLYNYMLEKGIEEGDLYSEEEFGTSFEQWLIDQGYIIVISAGYIVHEETEILIPEILEEIPIEVCPQLEEALEKYLVFIYDKKCNLLHFTFEHYLDSVFNEPFDYREIEKGKEIGRYYFIVDDFGVEIVS